MDDDQRTLDWDDHWSLDDRDTFLGECSSCGNRRLLQSVEDPFVSEGIIDSYWGWRRNHWCRPCYDLRCDEV